jgi:adenosylcobyric acid synthase
MSNFTDLDALASEPGVSVRFTRSAIDIERADLVVLPGTKATVRDLARLRESGLDGALKARAQHGRPVLGICGGYQMLGERIVDHVESGEGESAGIGLLPVETVFAAEKTLGRRSGSAPWLGDVSVGGFEIRHGEVTRHGGQPALIGGEPDATEDGCRVGHVLGTSWHGVLEDDGFRRALLGWVADANRRDWRPGGEPFAAARERRLDLLGDLIEEHVDEAALLELIERGLPAGMPTVNATLGAPPREVVQA